MKQRALTDAEHETLSLFANGMTTLEIGERLQVHQSIAQDRLRVAVRKLGALNRVHAVAIASDLGIIRVTGGRAPWRAPNPERDVRSKEIVERIRARAYQIWLQEGKPHGFAEEHWLLAEAEIYEETAPTPSPLPENRLIDNGARSTTDSPPTAPQDPDDSSEERE